MMVTPPQTFWKTAVAESSPFALSCIYEKKFSIRPDSKIAAAGSCFAQHISRHLRQYRYNVLDLEPPPPGFPLESSAKFGYLTYSARFGNIYTVHQLLQLAKEAAEMVKLENIAWEKGDKFIDAIRPSVEPNGLDSVAEVIIHRDFHTKRVRKMFETMDLFIFTLGLTEGWVEISSNTVFPMAPGTLGGSYDPEHFSFRNFTFSEIYDAFHEFMKTLDIIRAGRPKPRFILTVSPVPLTATATGMHILQASTYSKSILRAVAGQLSLENPNIDYFPSYEIITNQASRGIFYEPNMRGIRKEGVDVVMKSFFSQHAPTQIEGDNATGIHTPSSITYKNTEEDAVICEEALLEGLQK